MDQSKTMKDLMDAFAGESMANRKYHAYAAQAEKEGYPALAELIRQHHDLEQDASLEARLLFLADKMIRETEKVSLKQRFESSKAKCQTEQALAVWQSRYDTALKEESELKNMLAVDML